ncbi:MAG TPA: S9 family peptidase [Gemmatimonadales bacterium]|jgi:dipeptidyl aminopeptidase/acylaminoacyl peptidase|nr:S9 family peptidase [Gemmatimonadales bacterium]
MRPLTTLFALALPLLPTPALLAQKHALTVDEFLALKNVGDPQVSPDGKWVVYTVGTISLQDNKSTSRLWLANVATGAAKELSQGAGSDRSPRWSPDGQSLAFLSGREHGPQVWVMPASGGAARRVSDLPDGAGEMYWMPDGKGFLVVCDVKWPKDQEIDRRNGAFPTDAKLWTSVFYRHWVDWRAGMRQHVFSVDLASGAAKDLTPIDKDAPTIATSGDGDVAMSPDGKEIAVAIHADSVVADNTNVDVYLMNPDGTGLRDLTVANAGADNTPRFSPDGKWLAYLSMARGGFEADRLRLMLVPRTGGRTDGAAVEATAGWTLSIGSYSWCPDSKCLYAVVEERGRENLYRISLAPFQRTLVFGGNGVNTNLTVSADGKTRAWLYQSNTQPAEVFANDKPLTHTNDEAVSHLDLHPLESYGFVGAGGDSVFGWLLKPPGFDPARKYPVVYIVHGGPQGAWDDNWHARWNYQMFAARGYVVAAVNFHGSTGYGQAFTDAISRHWGDWPYEDVMKGLDLVARLPYVDSTRMGAAGASYGGYMVYWLAGHTNRFKVLVDHDGVFNPESMFGTTEELWFPKWEFGGTPYQEDGGNRALYEQWSPMNFVQNWKTPMLIVHSQLDYRVDLSEGYQAFTALKLHNVPGKFLYFPDEGHWVLHPRNRRLWWGVVMDWLDQYLKN